MFGWTEEPFAQVMEKGRRIAIADTARQDVIAVAVRMCLYGLTGGGAAGSES